MRLLRAPDVAQLLAKRDLDGLARTTRDRDAGVRLRAIAALSELGGAAATSALVHALDDRSPEVRDAARAALVAIGPDVLPAALDASSDPRPLVRDGAVEVVEALADERATKVLVEALRNPRARIRAGAADVLGRIGAVEAVGPLKAMTTDPNESVRRAARQALRRIAPAKPRIRASEVYRLAELGDRRALEPLVGMIEGMLGQVLVPKPTPIDALEHLLRSLGSDGIAEALSIAGAYDKPMRWHGGVLESRAHDVRMAVAETIARLGEIAVEPVLLSAENAEMRQVEVAAQAMTHLVMAGCRDPRAVALLGRALDSYDLRLAGLAATALGDLGPIAIPALVAKLRRQPRALSNSTRLNCVLVLGSLGGPDVVAPLIEVADDPWVEVRNGAIAGFGSTKDERAIEAIKRRLTLDSDAEVRSKAANTLANLGSAGVDALLEALSHASREVRRESVLALGRYRVRRAMPLLKEALFDTPYVAEAAGWALEWIGDDGMTAEGAAASEPPAT